jgi:hypothetical protein
MNITIFFVPYVERGLKIFPDIVHQAEKQQQRQSLLRLRHMYGGHQGCQSFILFYLYTMVSDPSLSVYRQNNSNPVLLTLRLSHVCNSYSDFSIFRWFQMYNRNSISQSQTVFPALPKLYIHCSINTMLPFKQQPVSS